MDFHVKSESPRPMRPSSHQSCYNQDMLTIRVENEVPREAVDFLKHSYVFANDTWQHATRDQSPDQGFEAQFRASCIMAFPAWRVSQPREMYLGHGMMTASGVLHEIDLVAAHPAVTAIAELKNRQSPPDKNDIILLFAKILDYVASNPELLLKELFPIFMSTASFDQHALEACLGLGIHPVSPGLRPLPLLVQNARIIQFELNTGLNLLDHIRDRFDDYCARLNSMCIGLTDTWIGSRFGYLSETTAVVRASPEPILEALGHSFRQLNAECTLLISHVREAKR